MQRLSRTQLKILNILWEKKRATAKDITDALNEKEPTAHSTVQTLLRRLERKGAVAHDADQRTFIFYPTISREHVKEGVVDDMIESLFHGSAKSIISYLVKNKYVSESEFEELHSLIEKDETKR